jgi:hypothetical protein
VISFENRHVLPSCKSCKTNSLVYFDTSVVMDTPWGDVPISYISCSIPPGSGFGALVAKYCMNVGHSSLLWPSVMHLVHHTCSHFSLSLVSLAK